MARVLPYKFCNMFGMHSTEKVGTKAGTFPLRVSGVLAWLKNDPNGSDGSDGTQAVERSSSCFCHIFDQGLNS